MNKDKLDAAIVKFEAMASDAIGIAISSEGNRQKKEAAMMAYNALDIGIAALRDMLKRREGCWHCHGIEAHEIDCITEIEDIYLQRIKTAEHIPYRYCASCGRKLEDEK